MRNKYTVIDNFLNKEDFITLKHNGAVFSLNTCDGFTSLDDGTKIESIENRLLLFDSNKPHASSTCTNAKARFNMNFNYF